MFSSYFFKTYGRPMVFRETSTSEPIEFYGFLQPLRYKNKMYLRGMHTDLGLNRERHYLYIGPPEYNFGSLESKDALVIDGVSYIIDRHEVVYMHDKPVYRWAIVRPIERKISV